MMKDISANSMNSCLGSVDANDIAPIQSTPGAQLAERQLLLEKAVDLISKVRKTVPTTGNAVRNATPSNSVGND